MFKRKEEGFRGGIWSRSPPARLPASSRHRRRSRINTTKMPRFRGFERVRCAALYLPSAVKLTFRYSVYLPAAVRSAIEPDLSRFGGEVLTAKVLDWVADAEKNPPFLRTWDTWGRRRDELVTSAGWRNLQDMGIAEGMVAIAYEGRFAEHSRLYQFIKFVRHTINLCLKERSPCTVQVSSVDRLLRQCHLPQRNDRRCGSPSS